jgi:hypothetical protein
MGTDSLEKVLNSYGGDRTRHWSSSASSKKNASHFKTLGRADRLSDNEVPQICNIDGRLHVARKEPSPTIDHYDLYARGDAAKLSRCNRLNVGEPLQVSTGTDLCHQTSSKKFCNQESDACVPCAFRQSLARTALACAWPDVHSRPRLAARHPQAPGHWSRAKCCGVLPGDLPALILHLATIEVHRTLSCDFEILC